MRSKGSFEGVPLRSTLVVLVGALFILGPALVNGFPFVYPDTGTYLASAFRGYVPIDRPYWYGVFMRLTSLGGNTFWGIVMGQALLCSLYIFRTVSLFSVRHSHVTTLLVILTLSVFSSLGWYAGQLMPDIFTGIGILAIYHLLLGNGRRWVRIADGVMAISCCWVHLSNLLILPMSGAVLILVHRRQLAGNFRRIWFAIAGFTLIAWAGLAIANRIVDREFYISRGGHVFLVAHMVDTGMLKAWLDDHCAEGTHRICAYKDRLPEDSGHFLWADSISPMHLEGGWLATRSEYDHIIRSTLTEPRYLAWHAGSSFSSLIEELTCWTICVGLENDEYRTPRSPPYVMIEGTIKSALDDYLGSLQNGGRGELSLRWPDRIYAAFTIMSFLLAVLFLYWLRADSGVDRALRGALLYAIGSVLIGCWVCASLAVVDDRYLARISWLVPMFVMIVAARRFSAPSHT